jgi:hypothetical protein
VETVIEWHRLQAGIQGQYRLQEHWTCSMSGACPSRGNVLRFGITIASVKEQDAVRPRFAIIPTNPFVSGGWACTEMATDYLPVQLVWPAWTDPLVFQAQIETGLFTKKIRITDWTIKHLNRQGWDTTKLAESIDAPITEWGQLLEPIKQK